MTIIVYSVWSEGTGDNFKGYNNKFHDSFKTKSLADQLASKVSGWVEEEVENVHEDYYNSLK